MSDVAAESTRSLGKLHVSVDATIGAMNGSHLVAGAIGKVEVQMTRNAIILEESSILGVGIAKDISVGGSIAKLEVRSTSGHLARSLIARSTKVRRQVAEVTACLAG